jgi:hypothetical protein
MQILYYYFRKGKIDMSAVAQLKNSKVRHLHLKIQDDKYNFFIELVNNLGFVAIESDKKNIAKCEKKRIIANIRQGFVDKKSIDESKLKTYPIEDLFND